MRNYESEVHVAKRLVYFGILTDLQRRIELIQDFSMPTASTGVQATEDGQYILATGE